MHKYNISLAWLTFDVYFQHASDFLTRSFSLLLKASIPSGCKGHVVCRTTCVLSRCPYFYFRANRPPLPPICPRKHTMHQRFARSTGTQTHPSYACIYTCTCRSVQAVCPRMGAKYPAHPPTIQHSCKCIRCPDQTTGSHMQHTNGNECVSLGICLQARVCM